MDLSALKFFVADNHDVDCLLIQKQFGLISFRIKRKEIRPNQFRDIFSVVQLFKKSTAQTS
jgi:hypothetical protein